MKTRKSLTQVFIISALLFSWVSMAGAWTYSVDTYEYRGSGALTGTVPGALYITKVAVIENETSSNQLLEVDLYYSTDFTGRYQYSPDGGTHWMWINADAPDWSRSVPAGGKIWIRGWLLNVHNNPFHVLSPSPWGVAAADELEEEYYFAFPPGSHYYAAGWVRDIAGFVAVIQPLD